MMIDSWNHYIKKEKKLATIKVSMVHVEHKCKSHFNIEYKSDRTSTGESPCITKVEPKIYSREVVVLCPYQEMTP